LYAHGRASLLLFYTYRQCVHLHSVPTRRSSDLFIIGRSRQLKELGKLGAPAGLFNVNEPIIFGLPIVMNPLILIPWLIAPVVVTIITYFAMSTGLVPPPAGIIVPWTTPPIL